MAIDRYIRTRTNMIQLLNKTGANSVKGTLVSPSTTTDLAVKIPTDQLSIIGVIAESGIADGQLVWVQITGIAEVLLVDSTTSTRGNFVYASTTYGRADASLAIPDGGTIASIQEHFKEVGHCLESKTAGTNVLCKIAMHFN